jgi:RNA polymerase sigma factor (sigma-70 family)
VTQPGGRASELLQSFYGSADHRALFGYLQRGFPRVSAEDIEDAISHGFDRLLAAPDFRGETPREVWNYLNTVARRFLLDDRKSARVRTAADVGAFDFDAQIGPASTPEQLLLTKEHTAVIAREVALLRPRRRTILAQHYAGRKRAEIARDLGLRPKRVEHELAKGIDFLRQRFAAQAGQGCTPERTQQVANYAFNLHARIDSDEVRTHFRGCPACAKFHQRLNAMSSAAAAILPLPLATAGALGPLGKALVALRRPAQALRRLIPHGGGTSVASSASTKLAATVATTAAIAGAGGVATIAHGAHHHATKPSLHLPGTPTAPATPVYRPLNASSTAPASTSSAKPNKTRRRTKRKAAQPTRQTPPSSTTSAQPTQAPAPAPAPSRSAQRSSKPATGGEFF